MAETAETILNKDVDGGVETVLLDLLARIEELESRPQVVPSRYTMEYPGGVVATYLLEP